MIFQKFYFSGIKAGISGSQPVNFFLKKEKCLCEQMVFRSGLFHSSFDRELF